MISIRILSDNNYHKVVPSLEMSAETKHSTLAPVSTPNATQPEVDSTTDNPQRQGVENPVETATTSAPKKESVQDAKDIFTNEEEPQNALTKKFTESEWKALKEFRVRQLMTQSHAYFPNS